MSMKFTKRQHRFLYLAILSGLFTMLTLSACGENPAATANPATTAASTTFAATTAATIATTAAQTTAAGTTVAATTVSTATTAPGTTMAAATTVAAGTAGTTAATTVSGAVSGDTSPKVVAAANAFLTTLDVTQKAAVLFDWSNSVQKTRWSNLPEGLYQRAGLMWGNLTDPQKQAWLNLMSTTLSKEGYTRVINEWNADDALTSGGGGGGPGNLKYGKQYYWVAIIGTPSMTTPWQWQWGGHHVTVNATVAGSSIALTPSFIGVQPATYKDANGTTIRPLGDIDDTASALLNSLDASQKAKAVLGTNSIDLVLGPGQDNKKIASEGLPASAMTTEQQNMLMKLIGYYGNLLNEEDAAARMADLKSHLNETYFAWYGSTTTPNTGYFRVSGPTIVFEYSPQSMGGNSAEHIHGIYRDPTNDYGTAIVTK